MVEQRLSAWNSKSKSQRPEGPTTDLGTPGPPHARTESINRLDSVFLIGWDQTELPASRRRDPASGQPPAALTQPPRGHSPREPQQRSSTQQLPEPTRSEQSPGRPGPGFGLSFNQVTAPLGSAARRSAAGIRRTRGSCSDPRRSSASDAPSGCRFSGRHWIGKRALTVALSIYRSAAPGVLATRCIGDDCGCRHYQSPVGPTSLELKNVF